MDEKTVKIKVKASEILKLAKVDFTVNYDDGTTHEVNEGVLIEANPDNSVTFHNGTSRPEVLFAATFALYEAIFRFGLADAYEKYVQAETQERKETK